MVLILWATVRIVTSLNWLWIRLVILVSVFTSIAEVASSRIKSLEFLVKEKIKSVVSAYNLIPEDCSA